MTALTAFWKTYGKLITYILGIVLTALAQVYGSTEWWPAVVAVATAVGIYYAPHVVSAP